MRERILIFNVNWLGDVLFSTAFIRNLRRNYPGSHIACVIPLRCAAVLKSNPHLNEVLYFDERTTHQGMLEKLAFAQALKRKKFDTVFLLHRSMSRALMCRIAGISERIGYYTRKRAFLLTSRIIPPDIRKVHRIDYYLGLLSRSGLAVEDRHPEFFLGPDDEAAADAFLKDAGVSGRESLVGLNPGGNWLPKRWPKEHWKELARELSRLPGVRLVITGSAQDAPLAEEIAEGVSGKPLISCAALDIAGFAALTRRMALFISADSGPLHIATASGSPRIIGLFGPTDVSITGPVPEHRVKVLQHTGECAIPCYSSECTDYRCMRAISVKEVLDEARAQLGG